MSGMDGCLQLEFTTHVEKRSRILLPSMMLALVPYLLHSLRMQ